MVWEVRSYRESDEPGVVSLWETVFPGEPGWNAPLNSIRRKITHQPELFFVAVAGTEVIGTAMAGFDGYCGWVYYVAVNPGHRLKGVGTSLMRRVEDELLRRGCPKLNLQVRASGAEVTAFYKKLGFAIEEKISMSRLLTLPASNPSGG